MRLALAAVFVISLATASCLPEAEAPDTTRACAAKLYSPYDPKNLDQCVNICVACGNGAKTTCSTSCTLKGAH